MVDEVSKRRQLVREDDLFAVRGNSMCKKVKGIKLLASSNQAAPDHI